MALTQYDKNNLTAAQQAGIQAATERYNNATTQAERDAAHAQAEAIRNNAGYTSDASGAYSGAYNRVAGGSTPTLVDSIYVNGAITGGISGDERAYQVARQQAQQNQYQAQINELTSALNEYKNLYNGQSSSYAQALAEQKAAQEAAVQQAVNTLENQKTDTTNSYNDLFRQLYLNKMKNQKNIGQQMAAMGVNGGAAESTLLGMNAQYEDALRQGEQGRLDAIRDLDQAITDARLTGSIEGANAAASTAKEQTNNYASVLQGLIDRYDNLNARQAAYDREDAANALAYDRESAETVRRYAYQTAMGMLNSGVMASDELLESAGIGKADAAAIVAANTPTESYTPSLTAAQVNAAIKSGLLTAEVLRAYEYYYGAPYRG